jgi:hypothetical protein
MNSVNPVFFPKKSIWFPVLSGFVFLFLMGSCSKDNSHGQFSLQYGDTSQKKEFHFSYRFIRLSDQENAALEPGGFLYATSPDLLLSTGKPVSPAFQISVVARLISNQKFVEIPEADSTSIDTTIHANAFVRLEKGIKFYWYKPDSVSKLDIDSVYVNYKNF